MATIDDGEARLVAAFLECFHEDAELGRRRRLVEYLERFPDAQEAVAREYLELIRRDDGAAEPAEGERRVGRYRLLRQLGSGGQGVVWLAEDPRLDRRVALKVLHGGAAAATELERFQREAAIASRLSHPGICAVYDTGCEDGVSYIAMQYVDGRSLADWIKERSESDAPDAVTGGEDTPATLDDAARAVGRGRSRRDTTTGVVTERREILEIVEAFEQVARAVHAAHEAGIVHRDIKPQNIMLRREGGPIILDFGIARSVDGGLATLTETGAVFGTPAYMAPEQVRGRRVDHRCDVYALGATLYECVTLRRPFEAPAYERLLAGAPRYGDAERARDESRRRKLHPALYERIDEEREAVRLLEARHGLAAARVDRIDPEQAREEVVEAAADELDESTCLLAEHRTSLRALESDPRAVERLDLGRGGELDEWRYDVLTDLVRDLARLRRLRADVEERRRVAAAVVEVTVDAERQAWDRCLADIRQSPRYGRAPGLAGSPYPAKLAELAPIRGLVPLGRDAESGLWEFWLQESGARPPWTLHEGVAGSLDVDAYGRDGAAGIVLVLLPGGRFRLGSEGPLSTAGEQPVQEIELAPFLCSKLETTQGQWLRVAGSNPSRFRPGIYEETPALESELTLGLPVTNVSHDDVTEMAARLDLELPTEAQWEYAARGGTTTVWWTGDDPALIFEKNAANLNAGAFRGGSAYDDGHLLLAPVGRRYIPNPFGLHNTIGNVAEWTRDRFGQYGGRIAAHDGFRQDVSGSDFIFRGGSFKLAPRYARSAQRRALRGDFETLDLGVRFSRSLP